VNAHTAERNAGAIDLDQYHSRDPSPSVRASVLTKLRTYQPLVDIAEAQRANNVRDHTPNFFPCALSHEGEFSGGAIQAIEHFTLAFKQTCEDAARMGQKHGYTVKQRASNFRTSMKDALICTSAQYFGKLLATAAGDAAFSMVSADDFSAVLNPWERVIVPAPTTLPALPHPSGVASFQQSMTPSVVGIGLSQQTLIGAA
jgi:hypothetical protein